MTGAERLVAACRGERVDATPVWFMRQAGGSLPRYLTLRERYSVIEIARTPEMCAEVSVGAAEALGTDGAVMFADIMLVAEALGVALTLTPDGPIVERPITTVADVARLRAVDVPTDLGFVLDAIGRTRRALDGSAAVIGIAGGPFTMAAYLIEGRPSRDQLVARRLAHADPPTWSALLDRITATTVDYVRAQAAAGAHVIQLFDSWAGVLSCEDYDRLVAPWSSRILEAGRGAGVPVIHYVAAGSNLLERLARGADVVGVDAAQSLAVARKRLGSTAVQGNLDPARLAARWSMVSAAVDAVLTAGGPVGHIFNTGYAVPRDTPPQRLRDIVLRVHDRTATGVAA